MKGNFHAVRMNPGIWKQGEWRKGKRGRMDAKEKNSGYFWWKFYGI